MIKTFAGIALLCGCGTCLATPITYRVDSAHTYPSFETDHTGLSLWRGKIKKNSGTVVLDREARTGTVAITMDMASIDFGHDGMNKHAVAEDIFDVARYPTAEYRGTIRFTGDVPSSVDGQLTLHGVTRQVTVTIKSFGCHPPGAVVKTEVCGADAYASFQRDDFGVDVGQKFGTKMDVRLAISIEARRVDPEGTAPASP